ncbi:glycosyltransferase [Brevundimonas sp.]|uniref:glycosyltransferase n=1 Tax=Brevundimonas sp. TaxID=1871086 RepID=UPI003D6D3795
MIDRFKRALAEFRKPSPASEAALARSRRIMAREALSAGNAARDDEDWAAAARFYADYLSQKPDAAPIHVQLGNMLAQTGDASGAERAYRQALTLAPDADGWLQLGRVLASGGRRAEAIEAFVEVGRLAPGNADVRTELAAIGAPELAADNDRPRSAHVRDLALVGGRLEHTLDTLRDWLAVSTYPLDAYDAFRRNFPITPPPRRTAAAVTVVVDALHASPARIRASLLALKDQSQTEWRALVLASAATLDHPVASLALADDRIRFAALEAVAAPAGAVLSITAGVVLHPEALAWFAFAQTRTEAAAVYCDQDRIVEHWRHGRRHLDPVLHSMPDREDLRTSAAPPEAVLFTAPTAGADLFAALIRRNDDPAAGAAARRDQLLAMVERVPVAHLPRILASVSELPDGAGQGLRPEDEAAGGLVAPAPLTADPEGVAPDWSLAVIVPTRDEAAMLEACVRSLFDKATRPERLTVVIADNRSREAETARVLADLAARFNVVTVPVDEPFNWSRINNLLAAERGEDLLVFANNDTVMLTEGWDEIVRRRAAADGAGLVGARLLYPDGTVQHGGMVLGAGEGTPLHEGVGAAGPERGPAGRWSRSRSAAAVTGAFMAVRREVFELAGGFDAAALAIGYNDVDFCLRVRRLGLRVVFAGDVELVHHESKTRGRNESRARIAWDRGELRSLYEAWGEALTFDPGHNPHWASAGHAVFDGFQEPTPRRVLRHLDLSARLRPWSPPDPEPAA